LKKGIREEDTNARSRTEGLEGLWREKQVCPPGVFRSVYICSAAGEKYRKEALSSEELCHLIRSAEGW